MSEDLGAKDATEETAEEKENKANPVTDDELNAAFSGPAYHANKIYLTLTTAGVRLAFMEQQGSAVFPQFRTAAILSIQDAISLKNLLVRRLESIEEMLKTAPAIVAKEDGE